MKAVGEGRWGIFALAGWVILAGAAVIVVSAEDFLWLFGISAMALFAWLTIRMTGSQSPVRASATPDARQHETVAVGATAVGLAFVGLPLLRLPGGLTVSDAAFAVAIVALLVHAVTGRARLSTMMPPGALMVGVGLFALGGLVSTLGAQYPRESIGALLRVVFATLALTWLAQSLATIRRVVSGMWLWALSAGVCGACAIAQFVTHKPLFSGALLVFGRYSGVTGHPNDLGAICAVALLPSLWLLARHRKTRWVALALPIAGCVLAGLALSGSVGATLAALAGLTSWAVLARAWKALLVGAAIVVVIALLSVTIESDRLSSPFHRGVTTTTSKDYNTLLLRIEIGRVVWARIQDHPLIGQGLGFSNESTVGLTSTGLYAHNHLLLAWDGAGLAGLLGMWMIIVAYGVICLRTVRSVRSETVLSAARALTSAYVAFLVLGLSFPILYQRFAWLVGSFVVALSFARSTCDKRRQVTRDQLTERGPRQFGGLLLPWGRRTGTGTHTSV